MVEINKGHGPLAEVGSWFGAIPNDGFFYGTAIKVGSAYCSTLHCSAFRVVLLCTACVAGRCAPAYLALRSGGCVQQLRAATSTAAIV